MEFTVFFFFFFLCFLVSTSSYIEAQVFDVTKYGARPDGTSDMTKALESAWKDACESASSSTVRVPRGIFALGVIKLEGPCKSAIAIQLQGTLKAPPHPAQMNSDGWLTFNRLDRLTLFGGGAFDGRGQIAWRKNDCHKNQDCIIFPVSIRFNFISNSRVHDITTLDSKNFHINLLGCENFTFERITIIAPDESPNTDGIHMGRSSGINILNSRIMTGDDCISMGDGSRNITISGVTCGPGHGISIGSLGNNKAEEPVDGVTVKNCTFIGTENGVRIKTWPKANPGIVTNIHYEDLVMKGVKNPIFIDQVYCPHNLCDSEPSFVKISKVTIKNIRGTSTSPSAVKVICSGSVPCEEIEIHDIHLTYNEAKGLAT